MVHLVNLTQMVCHSKLDDHRVKLSEVRDTGILEKCICIYYSTKLGRFQ